MPAKQNKKRSSSRNPIPLNSQTPGAGAVLVVETNKKNRLWLRHSLEGGGHRVSEASNGQNALREAAQHPPDLILLDAASPEGEAYETCRRLKAEPRTAEIPVLLVSVSSNQKDRLAALDAGANDFLALPLDSREVLMRVGNAMQAKRLSSQSREQLRNLEKLEALKDNLTRMIVQDLRAHLTTMLGCLDLIRLRSISEGGDSQAAFIDQLSRSTFKMADMIASLASVSRLEEGKLPLDHKRCDLADMTVSVVQPLCALAGRPRISLELPPGSVPVQCDVGVISRVLANLITNALEHSPAQEEVRVCMTATAKCVRLEVRDSGPGIPAAHHDKVFEKFSQVGANNRRYSSGLGLAYCKLAIEAHSGQIGIVSNDGNGCTFWFELPREAAANRNDGE